MKAIEFQDLLLLNENRDALAMCQDGVARKADSITVVQTGHEGAEVVEFIAGIADIDDEDSEIDEELDHPIVLQLPIAAMDRLAKRWVKERNL